MWGVLEQVETAVGAEGGDSAGLGDVRDDRPPKGNRLCSAVVVGAHLIDFANLVIEILPQRV